MYVNLNNPANFQLQEFEQLGFRYIVTGRPTISGETYRTIFVLTDAVVTATCPNGDSLSSETLVAGTVIHGFFEDVSVASGSLLAYKAGPITAQEIFDAYKAYVYAQGGIVEGESCAVADIAALLEDKLYSAASLVLIPSGYKVSHLYAERPLDSNGDFTFTRASSATRVNSSGLVEKVRTNLVTYSNDFSNAAWQVIATPTLTANYDTNPLTGENDAWRFVAAGTGDRLYQPISGSNSAFSLYVKGTGQIRIRDNSAIYSFNATLTSSWQRIVVSIPAAFTNVQITGGPGGCDATIYAAQLETGDIATDYIATTTAAVSVGPVSGLPRLDYLNSSCPRLLLEPQRTNSLGYSQNFDNAYFTKGNSSISANVAISPSGYQDADKLVPDTSNSSHSVYRSVQPIAGGIYSVFAKADGYDWILLTSHSSSAPTSRGAFFNVSDGTIGNTAAGVNAKIEDYGNGWYRCSISEGSSPSSIWTVIATNADNVLSFEGNGTDGVLIWGGQNEQGAYATSYIPTLGASVTRLADSASKTGISSLIGQTEGTVFLQFDNNLLSSYPNEYAFQIIGSGGHQLWMRKEAGGNYFTARLIVSSSTIWTSGSIPVPNGITKIAISYKTGDSPIYLNGTQFGSTNTAAFSGSSFTDFYFNLSGTANPELIVRQALLFKTRLTNAQLAELTTL
jgi:hypothetical protein